MRSGVPPSGVASSAAPRASALPRTAEHSSLDTRQQRGRDAVARRVETDRAGERLVARRLVERVADARAIEAGLAHGGDDDAGAVEAVEREGVGRTAEARGEAAAELGVAGVV